MAIAKTVEITPLLNAWQRVMNEFEFTFNQAVGQGAPLNDKCSVYIQPQREDIARGLDAALKKMWRVMGYWPFPRWFEDTTELGPGVPYQFQTQRTHYRDSERRPNNKLIAFGQRATTLLSAGNAVVYSDPLGYGVDTVATITIPTPAGVTDPAEIQAFFQVADGAPGAADKRYQIEPLLVTIGALNTTLVGHRGLFVKPDTKWDIPYDLSDPNFRSLNEAQTTNAAHFVTAVDVYRVYNDTTTQVQILDRRNTVLATVSPYIEDSELGLYTLPVDCLTCIATCSYPPVKLRTYYKAGLALTNGYIDSEIEDAIVRLANVLMPNEFCSMCARALDRWRQDRSPMVYQNIPILTSSDVANPFGSTLQGAVWAYRVAKDRAIQTGGKLTRGIR